MPSENILITWLVLRNTVITCQKLSNILNKFQMFLLEQDLGEGHNDPEEQVFGDDDDIYELMNH